MNKEQLKDSAAQLRAAIELKRMQDKFNKEQTKKAKP